MKLIWIEYDGTEHVLHDTLGDPLDVNGCDLFIKRESGMGLPAPRHVTEQGPYQEGETWRFKRLVPRPIRLTLVLHGRYQDILIARETVARWFNPSYSYGTLRRDRGYYRDIVARYSGGFDFSMVDVDADELLIDLELIAHDPLFSDPVEKSYAFTTLAVQTHLVFPITFPIFFGSETINSTETVTVSGDWNVFPTVQVTGPAAAGWYVNNLSTDEKLEMNYAIAAGEQVTFDLSYRVKTIENNFGTNLMQYLTPDSDLATFHLGCYTELTGGINSIHFFADSVTGATKLTVRWTERYLTA